MLSTTYDLTTGSSSRNILSAIGFYMSQVSKFTFKIPRYFELATKDLVKAIEKNWIIPTTDILKSQSDFTPIN
jgi:hypothetical protein